MSVSYDSVTPKRRPVVRVVLASLLVMLIFGASVSAAAVGGSSDSSDVDETSTADDSSNGVVESALINPETDSDAVDAAAEASVVVRGIQLDADVVANEHRILMTRSLAFTGQLQAQRAAQIAAELEAAEAAELEAQAQARSLAVAVEDANRALQLAAATPGERAAILANELGEAATEEEAQAAWDEGYAIGGGSNLSSFHNTILPCESGSQPDRDRAVGRTDDWGRSQVNRPVWRTTFQELTGEVFEEGIVKPALNGYMAAYIEEVQGLTAWTCWRNR